MIASCITPCHTSVVSYNLLPSWTFKITQIILLWREDVTSHDCWRPSKSREGSILLLSFLSRDVFVPNFLNFCMREVGAASPNTKQLENLKKTIILACWIRRTAQSCILWVRPIRKRRRWWYAHKSSLIATRVYSFYTWKKYQGFQHTEFETVQRR
jgi:hypothetical protein